MAESGREHGGHCLPRVNSSWGWIFVAFGVMAVVLLWQEHRAHLLGVIPYLILLAGPLMHLLHRGHHRGHRSEDRHA